MQFTLRSTHPLSIFSSYIKNLTIKDVLRPLFGTPMFQQEDLSRKTSFLDALALWWKQKTGTLYYYYTVEIILDEDETPCRVTLLDNNTCNFDPDCIEFEGDDRTMDFSCSYCSSIHSDELSITLPELESYLRNHCVSVAGSGSFILYDHFLGFMQNPNYTSFKTGFSLEIVQALKDMRS